MRITRGVFLDLAIWMVGFGLWIGLAFPFFVTILGVSPAIALKPVFFAACLGAGALAGIVSYTLARWVVGARLKVLARSMNDVEQNLKAMIVSGDLSRCTPENCVLPVDSNDEIGRSAQAFNRLVESLAIATKAQAVVRSFSEMLTSELETQGLVENALRRILDGTGATGGLIVCESPGGLRVTASYGLAEPDSAAMSRYVTDTLRTGRQQVITLPDGDRIAGLTPEERFREVLAAPVVCKGAPLGVVVLATARRFDADDQALVDVLLRSLGLALRNSEAHESLQMLAALDPLTGVYNRRLGLDRLRQEYTRTLRDDTPLGVLIFDVDHFKATNDAYGHLVGDRVLKSVCDTARAALREGDVLFRYGGDEFAGVLPAASPEDLLVIGERLRRAVEADSGADDDNAVRVTVSVGGASCSGQSLEDEDELLRLADEALYRAKDLGRNRLEIWGTPTPEIGWPPGLGAGPVAAVGARSQG